MKKRERSLILNEVRDLPEIDMFDKIIDDCGIGYGLGKMQEFMRDVKYHVEEGELCAAREFAISIMSISCSVIHRLNKELADDNG